MRNTNNNPNTHTISFEITSGFSSKNDGKLDTYYVECKAMKYKAYTKNPEETVHGLVNEWFDYDMGNETPIL